MTLNRVIPCANRIAFLATLIVMLPIAQASNTIAVQANVISNLELTVSTPSLTWHFDPTSSPYTQTLEKNNGIMVKANKANWVLYVRSQKPALTDWDGSTYGTMALHLPLTLQSYPDGTAIGKTVQVSINDQELVINGEKGGNKKVGLGFTQPISWDDEPLPSGHNYSTVLIFTAGV